MQLVAKEGQPVATVLSTAAEACARSEPALASVARQPDAGLLLTAHRG